MHSFFLNQIKKKNCFDIPLFCVNALVLIYIKTVDKCVSVTVMCVHECGH